jgi:FAD/FMN-containing dehydrogenase
VKRTRSTIERDLRGEMDGEILTDEASRNAYSTAACIYRIKPLAVAVPRSIEDVQRVLRYAHEYEVPLIPRGGATSLAGQAVGFGVALDCATHFKGILEINREEDWVRVQPGVVLDDLNATLRASDKFFPPDPASSDRCVVGGMISTNASGAHGLKYGATKDHVLALTVALPNGEVAEFEAKANELKPRTQVPSGSATAIERSLEALILEKKTLIYQKYPKVQKNSCGYNLIDAVRADGVDVTRVLTGSEGTLGVIVEAKVRIGDRPAARATGLAYFRTHDAMAEAVLASLPLHPAAVELMDKTLLDLAHGRSDKIQLFLEEGAEALLLFEFEAEDQSLAEEQLENLRKLLTDQLHLAFAFRVNPENLGSLWEVRKEATHILEELQTRTRKASFIEDVTVPVESLPDYLRGLAWILRSHGISYSIYGHAGVGNVHCEPFLDLSRADHRSLLDLIANEVFEFAISLGGTLSGEHGDGFVRTPFLERLYGRELYSLFHSVKELFDPRGILNPGKIIGLQGESIAHDLKME